MAVDKVRTKAKKPAPEARGAEVSRRTVGLNVVVSILAAGALLVVANVIGHASSYRRDMETLAGYGLSESARRILTHVDAPVRLTTIYTSTRPDKDPGQYLPRLRDLLEEMRRRKSNLTVVHVTGDRQKAEVVARLRQRLDEAAAGHRKVLADFQTLSDRQKAQFEESARKWGGYPADGWLGQFGMAKVLESAMNDAQDELGRQAAQQRQELAGDALPDYPRMVQDVQDTLDTLRTMFGKITQALRGLADVPGKVEKSAEELKSSTAAVTQAAQAVIDSLGGPTSAPVSAPADPAQTLDRLAAAAGALSQAAEKTARALETLAEDPYIVHARAWRTREGSVLVRYQNFTNLAGDLASNVQSVRLAAKPEIQKQFVEQIRPQVPMLLEMAKQFQADVDGLVKQLSAVDEPTRQIFQQAKDSDYLVGQTQPVEDMLKAIEQLSKLDAQTELIEQSSQDNIVLVEVGDKIGVVGFDEVWPLSGRSDPYSLRPQEEQKREFYGDMAISSKMLNLSAKPFAEVLLTYFERVPPRQFWQQAPPMGGPIFSMQLRTLRERLEKANLKVADWNLAEQNEPPPPSRAQEPSAVGQTQPAEGEPLPRVMLVLPPPEPSPMPGMEGPEQWTDEHRKRITDQVAAGTPAIFLASYFRPQSYFQPTGPPYALAEYLRDQWGLDVKTAMRVIQGEPDPLASGTFTLPVLRWSFMPLSDFTGNPVGKPLQARRMYWLDVCPILRTTEGKEGVAYSDILVVPRERSDVWASAEPEALMEKLYAGSGSGVKPDPGPDKDRLPPFALAVEASRTTGDTQQRIIVLGVGFSFIDGYLNMRVPRLTGETLGSDPPPTGNVDLVINAAYHLVGRGEFIGAGPAVVRHIRLIGPRTMSALKVGVGVGWPALVLVLGGVVMLARRR